MAMRKNKRKRYFHPYQNESVQPVRTQGSAILDGMNCSNDTFYSTVAYLNGDPSLNNLVRNPSLLDDESRAYYTNLSEYIWNYFINNRQTSGTYGKKMKLRFVLHQILSSVFPYCNLFIVGSSLNGFGTDKSDIDFCLHVTEDSINQKMDAQLILDVIAPALRKSGFLYNVRVIRAKVPIIKFRDAKSNAECDMNVNNTDGIYNTHLLAMYAKLDWRVRPLAMFVKLWASSMHIHDASMGRFSTYSLNLLVLFYLIGVATPPVLVNLQELHPDAFDYKTSMNLYMKPLIDWSKYKSSNDDSLGDLFFGFIDFYSNKMDWSKYAVSVCQGRLLDWYVALASIPPSQPVPTKGVQFFIQDPINHCNVARAVHEYATSVKIRRAFCLTYQHLRSLRPVSTILHRTSRAS